MFTRTKALSTLVVSLMLTVAPVAAPAAQADSAHGCNWPEACIYSEGNWDSPIIGRFRDETTEWQNLTHPEFDFLIFNSRNDDTIYAKVVDRTGWLTQECVQPNLWMGRYATLVAIRIDPSPTCWSPQSFPSN